MASNRQCWEWRGSTSPVCNVCGKFLKKTNVFTTCGSCWKKATQLTEDNSSSQGMPLFGPMKVVKEAFPIKKEVPAEDGPPAAESSGPPAVESSESSAKRPKTN